MAGLLCALLLLGCTAPDGHNAIPKRKGGHRRNKDDRVLSQASITPTSEPAPLVSPAPEPPREWWKHQIDKAIEGRPMDLVVGVDGATLYSDGARNRRPPASVQKLLFTMALFDTMGPQARLTTSLAARDRKGATVEGDLWIVGSGDPTLGHKPAWRNTLAFGATNLGSLVTRLKRMGITTVAGGVRAARLPFKHDWFAPGWKSYFPISHVGLPSALTLNGNVHKRQYTKKPEKLVAESLRKLLQKAGIAVSGAPGTGAPPKGLNKLTNVRSRPLWILARFMNRQSNNFFAEVLAKRLAVETAGPPGTIAKGARAIERYARRRGVELEAHDASGLSYDNRVSPRGIVRLLARVEKEPWFARLRHGLAGAGEGTLKDRLANIRIRAKTGTLIDVSALAGWIWLERSKAWARFAILSRGIPKSEAIKIEDRIVHLVAAHARA
ncbi:MAG: D-alanyl-D-alanine carboxypeptidase [Actinomycetota bacterium]|nr:D-alanyl-D-alanine carboxypeptidase [Actinomycetota bacterium]